MATLFESFKFSDYCDVVLYLFCVTFILKLFYVDSQGGSRRKMITFTIALSAN